MEKTEKAEAKQMVKKEKAVAKADKAAAKAAAKSKERGSKGSSDDEVEISGIKLYKAKSMKFWEKPECK